MQDLILTALTRDDLAALIDKRLDLAFTRHRRIFNDATPPGEAGQPIAPKPPKRSIKNNKQP